MAQFKTPDTDFAPALDADPVFERPAADGRWEAPPTQDRITSVKWDEGSGTWADTKAVEGPEEHPSSNFLDPASMALSSHFSPLMASSSPSTNPINGASADLEHAPTAKKEYSFGGGDGGE
jgi:hypothetical protein